MYRGMSRDKSLSKIGIIQQNHRQSMKPAYTLKKSNFLKYLAIFVSTFLKRTKFISAITY